MINYDPSSVEQESSLGDGQGNIEEFAIYVAEKRY
jgi:hypothetical protein